MDGAGPRGSDQTVEAGAAVLVRDAARWVPGTVLWHYPDCDRERALVRYVSVSGVVVRRLHWLDELRLTGAALGTAGTVIELPLQVVRASDASAGRGMPRRRTGRF